MGQKLLDFDSSFIRGANSSMDPSQLPLGYAWSLVNMINIGGVLSCRPGYRCIVQFPRGNLQGATIFRPLVGLEQIVVAVDGIIYVAEYPFRAFRQLNNVLMSSSAKQVFWMGTIQSAQRITPGSQTSAIEVIQPKSVLFIQDGGFTAPAWYDGSNSGHIRDLPFQTPVGGPMEWVGDRLWVGNGHQVFASDIANPFSFVEQIYLGGTTSFNFSSDVTAMVRTPSLVQPQLLVYTDEDVSIIQADIRDRSLWPTTPGMQREILQVGCSSDRAVTSHFGKVVWFSHAGVTFFDPATSQTWTSRAPIRDNEMMVSKTALADDTSLVAMGAFGQWLLVSVPSEDNFNKHTWCINNASWETITDEGGPTWSGFWLGTRPVEWVFGVIAGAERIYHVSTDEDGENRLWECFLPERLDNGCPIMWGMFSRGYFGLTGQAKKPPGYPVRFMYADVALTGIDEDLDLGVFVAPGVRGQYQQILQQRLSVDKGSLAFDRDILATTDIFAYKAQSRIKRTQDLQQVNPDQESGSCPVESDLIDGIEESFQMLVVGHGPATIRWIRPFAMVESDEDKHGNDKACQNEDGVNVVRFDGAAVNSPTDNEAAESLSLKPVTNFTANATVSLTYQNITAVGVGFSQSIVAAQAAERVANIIALKQAENEIIGTLPQILSIGEGFDA